MYRTSSSNGGGRVSVKGQRKIQSTSSAPARKKENAPANGVIGVSSVSLSSRFSGLTKEFDAKTPQKKQNQKQPPQLRVKLAKKPAKSAATLAAPQTKKQKAKAKLQQEQQLKKQQQQQQKLTQVAQSSRSKRQQVVDKRRKGLEPAAAPKNAKQATQPKKGQAANTNTAGRGGRGRGRGGAVGGRGGAAGGRGGRGGRGGEKKEVTGDELDVEMDSYWFEGGKGPDPKAAQLDRQMEQYWADKPKDDTFAAKEEAEKEMAAL